MSVAATRIDAPRRSEGTRQALLEAGERLFAELGFDGATVDQIVREAGVNKAMVSYHFGGKEGLYAAILLEGFAPLRERVVALRSSRAVALERLRAWIRIFAEAVAARPRLPALIVREVIDGGERLERHGISYIHELLAAVHEIIAAGVRSGEFRAVDPFLTHLTMVGALQFFSATSRFRERIAKSGRVPGIRSPTIHAFADHLEELLVHGIENRRRASRPRKRVRRSR